MTNEELKESGGLKAGLCTIVNRRDLEGVGIEIPEYCDVLNKTPSSRVLIVSFLADQDICHPFFLLPVGGFIPLEIVGLIFLPVIVALNEGLAYVLRSSSDIVAPRA